MGTGASLGGGGFFKFLNLEGSRGSTAASTTLIILCCGPPAFVTCGVYLIYSDDGSVLSLEFLFLLITLVASSLASIIFSRAFYGYLFD